MTSSLSAHRIDALRSAAAQPVTLRIVEETGSTNADLLSLLPQLDAPTLLVAERQTAGRGRAGRSWHSAPGASLTCSLAWPFRRQLHELAGLSLAVGVTIAETLTAFGVDARLKWPNDVLRDGAKLAGVLIETAAPARAGQPSWGVIGIGVNLALPDALAERIGQPAALAPGLLAQRDAFVAALLNALAEALPLFDREGFSPFVARWNALHAHAGRAVQILDRGEAVHEGIAAGVDDIGRLLVETAGGHVAVLAGDVSLRLQED